MKPALAFDPPDPTLEAGSDGTARRAQRANRAGIDTINDKNAAERDTVQQLLTRLKNLQTGLRQRLLAADGSLTDFRQFHLQALLGDVDRLIADATADLAKVAQASYERMANIGADHATDPLHAAQLQIHRALPGIDSVLVQAAFGNTVDLLTAPMQQFATDVKVSVRRVAMGGDNRFTEIQRLRDKIGGAGFAAAQFKAERIVRTEIGRVFNQATYDRLVALSKDFPFLRKGWRASKDNRTRLGHRQAAETYARGSGIPVADRFAIQVHDERGKTVKTLGTAYLRYPIDPDATPAGQLAASATIMCRCNSFVDFDMGEFAAFTAAKGQTALTGLTPPSAPKPAPKLPAVKKPKTVKQTVKVPKVKVPTAADMLPAAKPPEPTEGPTGNTISKAFTVIGAKAKIAVVEAALKELDSVNGATKLQPIPLLASNSTARKYGHYSYGYHGANEIKITGSGMERTPFTTIWHEVGHYLDHSIGGFGRAFGTQMFMVDSPVKTAMEAWKKAVAESKAYKTLIDWRLGKPGTPAGIHKKHLRYLTSTEEAFARSYAQYVATKSGHAAGLQEILNMTGTTSAVGPDVLFNRNPMGTRPEADRWDYPKQWTAEDFRPIEAAFDRLMDALGWRSKK